jgi:hypothetical protein
LGFSRWIMARALPSRRTPDLLAGMWALLSDLGGVPKTLVLSVLFECGTGFARPKVDHVGRV